MAAQYFSSGHGVSSIIAALCLFVDQATAIEFSIICFLDGEKVAGSSAFTSYNCTTH